MSELKEFTAEEFPEWILHYLSEEDAFAWFGAHKADPELRMKAICKHLFELMPQMDEIAKPKEANKTCFMFGFIDKSEIHNEIRNCDYGVELSINPFLHTDITQITREEVMGC